MVGARPCAGIYFLKMYVMADFFKSSLSAPNMTPSSQIIGNSLSSAGSGLSAAAKSGLIGAGISAASGLIGTGLQALMMRRQNKYNIAQFNREVARQDYLLNNQATITKNSLRNAGYSTANPEGMTTQATASPAGSTPDIPAAPDVLHNLSAIAQLRLAEAQADKTKVETRKTATESDILDLDLEKYKQTLPELVATVKQKYYNLTSENQLIRTQIDNLAETTANINVDTRFKEATFDQRKEQLFNEVAILVKENKIKEVSAKLADYGIVLGASDIGTILSVAASGKGQEATKMFADFIASVVGALPSALGQVIKSIWDAAIH